MHIAFWGESVSISEEESIYTDAPPVLIALLQYIKIVHNTNICVRCLVSQYADLPWFGKFPGLEQAVS
jgi:hypothetical protein